MEMHCFHAAQQSEDSVQSWTLSQRSLRGARPSEACIERLGSLSLGVLMAGLTTLSCGEGLAFPCMLLMPLGDAAADCLKQLLHSCWETSSCFAQG